MKAVVLALALLTSCALAEHGGGRRLLQSPTSSPSSSSTVFDVATEADLTTLVDLLTLDGLEPYLGNSSNPLSYTIFAPTNEALASYLQENDLTVTQVQNAGYLDPILQYHFLIYPYDDSTLISLGTVGTNYENQTLSFSSPGTITAFGSTANITQSNVQAGDSIIHVIDAVLVPDLSGVGTAPATSPTAATA